MKVKRFPQDFQVEELTNVVPAKGPFALYRLTKTSIGTMEAIDLIARRWQIHRRRISYGGLKDKHAVTRQFITVQQGPHRDFEHANVALAYLGQTSRPFTAGEISGNRFEIVIRDLTAETAATAQRHLQDVAAFGVPNYFDDQRFGSVGYSGEFVGQAWCKGDYERALWLALADPHPFDRSQEKSAKQFLRDHWGDWVLCKQELPRSHRRSIVTYLCDHPANFRGAFARIRVDLRGMYLSAFQSYLWNVLLASWLTENCPADDLFPVKMNLGTVPYFSRLSPDVMTKLAELTIALPSARQHLPEGPEADFIERVLSEMGLSLREIRVKYPRDSFFSKGRRAALSWPGEATSAIEPDEEAKGKKLKLGFTLAKGSYATVVIKRITGDVEIPFDEPEDEGEAEM
ncbi:MAG: tRNA pseudouridine(13) synthase TruD [Planctomycetaceae bacterium]